jgi:hypothetical protein
MFERDSVMYTHVPVCKNGFNKGVFLIRNLKKRLVDWWVLAAGDEP